MSSASDPVLCLVRDLLFLSKITATARSIGVEVKTLRDPVALATAVGRWLIVDLNQENALAAAAAWRTRTGGAVVGFVSHVDTGTITAARAAGIDRILARSAFVEQLPRLLDEGGRS